MGRTDQVKAVVALIKAHRNKWRISHRGKNLVAMAALGIDLDQILNEIYCGITWQDYVSGPEADRNGIPGPIWVFGMVIEEVECYLKFQIKRGNIIFWISTHPAEYPLHYPFKSY
ncbi:hypothetical protein D1831_10915 [Lactiplantibacillus garii]|uniref:Uncharacterized protein n=1 Tax=Lactiplantibacillus garii TaxID=2306423 RepID=A0A3R8KDH6_9LACO|nr:hypothetical protein [Lactiplantibacillus garii]RRK09759.1 hypothetical protein D1831_10915 [Lactiplantibacillus garii]